MGVIDLGIGIQQLLADGLIHNDALANEGTTIERGEPAY